MENEKCSLCKSQAEIYYKPFDCVSRNKKCKLNLSDKVFYFCNDCFKIFVVENKYEVIKKK